jgi:para-nitrobenzyl esterase
VSPTATVRSVVRAIALTNGAVQPDRIGDVVVARNIPYATAERFAAPRPAPGWTGMRDGRTRGPVCPQLPSRLEQVTGPVVDGLTQAEDCQVLSVAAPADAERGSLPVLVWLHGGAYLTGGGEALKYDPVRLAAEGRMVVVTVTYRLGVFGYLPPSTATAGNLGLLDQAEALRWVGREIRAFGGDPNRVTVAGQSAGADSIYCLLLAHSGEGLFQQAILTSTPLGLRHGRQPMTDALQAIVDEELGVTGDLTTERVLSAQARVVEAARAFGAIGGLPLAPITGVGPLPSDRNVTDALATAATRVDLLIGYAQDDAAAFVAGGSEHPLADPSMAELVHAATDAVFASPARALAHAWRNAGGRATTFVFDAAPEAAPFGACHCIELPYVFGTDWSDAPMLGGAHPAPATTAAIRGAWTTFAHHGYEALGGRDIVFT